MAAECRSCRTRHNPALGITAQVVNQMLSRPASLQARRNIFRISRQRSPVAGLVKDVLGVEPPRQGAQCFKRPRRQVDDPVLSTLRVLRCEADDPLAHVELFPTQAENLSLPQPLIVGYEQDGTENALGSLKVLLESLFRDHDPTDVGLTDKLKWVAREIATSDRVVQDAAKQGYLAIQATRRRSGLPAGLLREPCVSVRVDVLERKPGCAAGAQV